MDPRVEEEVVDREMGRDVTGGRLCHHRPPGFLNRQQLNRNRSVHGGQGLPGPCGGHLSEHRRGLLHRVARVEAPQEGGRLASARLVQGVAQELGARGEMAHQ